MGSLRSHLFVLVLFTLLNLLIFWPIFFGKVNLNGNLLVSFYAPWGENLPFKNTGWDQLRIYFPFYKVTQEAFRSFAIPTWNPWAFSGHPHMADFQSAVFYPLNIFILFLPQIEFWHLLRVTPTILAAFFTFLYLRNLKLSSLSALFGAITFGFSPFILTWGEEVVMSPHSIIWLPLVLFSIDKYVGGGKRIFLFVLGLSVGISFLGGYMQTSIYLMIFALLYTFFRVWNSNLRGWQLFNPVGWVLADMILGVGLSAVQLLPSAELYFNSARSQVALTEKLYEFLLPPESMLTFMVPDFFGHPATGNFFRGGSAQYYEGILFVGIAAFIFAIGAFFSKGRSRFVLFLGVAAVISILMTLDWFGAKLFLNLPVPFLSTSIPNRILFISAFCLAVLAAIGFENWQKKKGNFGKILFAVGGIYGGLILLLLTVKYFNLPYFKSGGLREYETVVISLRNLVVPLGVFLVCAILILGRDLNKRIAHYGGILIISASFLHIFYFSIKYFSFSERKYIFPQTDTLSFIQNNQGYFRSWGVGDAFLENNFASQYGIFWPEGYDSLNNRSYGEFTLAMQGVDFSQYTFRADAGLGRGKTQELLESKERSKLIDLVGVKYLIGNTEDAGVFEANNYKQVFVDERRGFSVFENLQVMPRAFLASNYEGPPQVSSRYKTADEIKEERRDLIVEKLLSDSFDFRNVLVLEDPSPISAQYGEGSADIVSYKLLEVVIKTSSQVPKLLFLSDNYFPGWKATVDGERVEILRADYTFRAVPLLAGEHEVRFYYDPLSFKIGLLVSVLSIAVLGFLFLKDIRAVLLPSKNARRG